ncbi:MAG: hypothetical protein ACR2FZ_08855 [Thermoleophilaceae bacterium]
MIRSAGSPGKPSGSRPAAEAIRGVTGTAYAAREHTAIEVLLLGEADADH